MMKKLIRFFKAAPYYLWSSWLFRFVLEEEKAKQARARQEAVKGGDDRVVRGWEKVKH